MEAHDVAAGCAFGRRGAGRRELDPARLCPRGRERRRGQRDQRRPREVVQDEAVAVGEEAGQVVEITLRLERVKDDLAERLENEGKVDLYGIYFDTDKATLKSESEGTLNQVLSLLKAKPDLRIALAGHTDSQASDSHNLDLSKRRAQAVVKWLTDKGVDGDRLEAEGFGETQPVADNDSAAGRALNRRVEIRDLSRGEKE